MLTAQAILKSALVLGLGKYLLMSFFDILRCYICDACEADGGTRLTSFNTKITSLHDLETRQLYSNQ